MPSSSSNNNQQQTSLTSVITNYGDRFETFKFLGQGAGGPVSAAFDLQNPHGKKTNDLKTRKKAAVALKRITKGNATKEFSILLHMQHHANVVKAFELIENDENNNKSNNNNNNNNNSNVMVMEFANLGNASKLAVSLGKSGSIAQREWYAQRVTRDILKALQYLHSNNVVHRDVKASNSLCFTVDDEDNNNDDDTTAATSDKDKTATPEENSPSSLVISNPVDEILNCKNKNNTRIFTTKLSDFGLAERVQETDIQTLLSNRSNSQTAHSDELAGSVYWLSPESLQGLVAPCLDIWSLGCLTYELLNAGRPPLNDREWANAMYVVLSCQDKKETSLLPTLMKFARDENSTGGSAAAHKRRTSNNNEPNQYKFLEHLSPSCLDFLEKALTIDPTKRPSADDLLQHSWLTGTNNINKINSRPPVSKTDQQQNNKISITTTAANQNLQPSSLDQTSSSSFALERLVAACSQGIQFANRSWLWLPKSNNSSSNNNNNSGASPPATPLHNNFSSSLSDNNNTFNGSGTNNASNDNNNNNTITDAAHLTPYQRAQIKERVRETIERLRRTSELVRDNVLAAVSPFAEQKSFASTLTNFETWFEIVPPSTDVMAMTTAHLQSQHSATTDTCQQAIVLISRVVWALSSLLVESYSGNQNNNHQMVLNFLGNNNNHNNIINNNIASSAASSQQQYQQNNSNNNNNSMMTTISTMEVETQTTRQNLILDLAECGFWTSSRGLDWTALFPSVVSITRTNPTTFKEVEGRSRYTELCRDTARGLFRLFEASCYHSDIRCLKACVRSPHTIRYLFAHECTRRDTAICLCNAISRLGEVQIIHQNSLLATGGGSSAATSSKHLRRQSSLKRSGSNPNTNSKSNNNNSSKNKYDTDSLFSPDRVVVGGGVGGTATSVSAGGAGAGAIPSSMQPQNNNNNNSGNNSNNGSVVLGGSSVFYDPLENSINNTNGPPVPHPAVTNSETGPQQIILTAQALRTLLPHFIDEAALAVASDVGSDPDHQTFDIVCDAFLRVTAGSNELFTNTVSSTIFLRKLNVGLPPNRISNNAVAVLTKFAVTIESIDDLLRLVPLATWLTLAANANISHARCAETIEIIARLRAVSAVGESLIKENPVVAYCLNRPVDSSSYENQNEAPTRLLKALKVLCSEPALGASYAASSSIRDGAMNRLREAARYKRYNEAVAAIELLGVLFTFSPNPDLFTNSDELLRLLLKFVKAPMNPQNRMAIKVASRFFNAICAVASL